MPEPRKLRVFLCHSSNDKPAVRELYQRLKGEGWIDPWLDEEKLYPGQDWDLEIEKAVEAADAVIVFLSNNSVSKEGYIQRELRFVLRIADFKPEGTVFVIPLRLEDCPVPRRLSKWQYVNYFPENQKHWTFKRLLGSLQARANKLDFSVSLNKIDIFAVMPFVSKYDPIYEYILDTAKDMNKTCKKAGKDLMLEANSDIFRDIEFGIKNAEIIVADLSDGNLNVYFEVGISYAWQKKVVLIAEEGKFGNIPDTLLRQRILFYRKQWGGEAEFKNNLQERLEEKFSIVIDEKNNIPVIDSSSCFIITSSTDDGHETYETIIQGTVERLDVKSVYLWNESFWQLLDTGKGKSVLIEEKIQSSTFVIADLSWNEPLAFYLAGLTYGLGKDYKFLYHKDEEPPFDIRDLNILRYSNKSEANREMARNILYEWLQTVVAKNTKQVEIIFEGEFGNFTTERQKYIIGVLAVLLEIDSSRIRVLRVYEGSIILLIEIPEDAADLLYKIAITRDSRIMKLDIKSVLVEGKEIISFTNKNSEYLHTKSILFLASEPTDRARLRLGQEFREIRDELSKALQRDRFKLELPETSLRVRDITRALLETNASIIHFSGHGGNGGQLFFETNEGTSLPVEPNILADLFKQFSEKIKCVVLNACFSEKQAIAIAKNIDYVIGMRKEVSDSTAIAFSIGFYQALGANKSIEEAFEFGKIQSGLQSVSEYQTPVLLKQRQ